MDSTAGIVTTNYGEISTLNIAGVETGKTVRTRPVRSHTIKNTAKTRRNNICAYTVQAFFIGFLWMVLLVPIILFQLPDSVYIDETINGVVGQTPIECSSSVPYPVQDGMCQGVLEDILMKCDVGETPLVLRDNEAAARIVIPAFMRSPSSECVSAAVPLLCLHLFGLCDSSGVSIQPTSGQCRNVRDNLCSAEWQEAVLSGLGFPDCEIFPEDQASCLGRGDNIAINKTASLSPNSSSPELFPCQEDFFRPEGSTTCVGDCHLFTAVKIGVASVFVAPAIVIGFISGVVVLILSVFKRKQMFSFPTIFIVYMNIDVTVLAFFLVFNFFNRPFLYCTSRDLVASIIEPGAFCAIAGVILTYVIMQIACWWIFHTSILLWKIGLPFHARLYESTGKVKYIHMTCGIIGILVPLIPVIAQLIVFDKEIQSSDELLAANTTLWSGGLGLRPSSYPPFLCFGRNGIVAYYSGVFPVNVAFFPGIAELILLIGIVHKQQGLFRKKKKEKQSVPSFRFGIAERKVLLMLIYFLSLFLFGIPTLALSNRGRSLFQDQLRKYLVCEAGGVDPNNPEVCTDLRDSYRRLIYPEMIAISFFMLVLLPFVSLIFIVDFTKLKEKWMKLRGKLGQSNCRSQ